MGLIGNLVKHENKFLDFGTRSAALKGFRVKFRKPTRDDIKGALGSAKDALNGMQIGDAFTKNLKVDWEGLLPGMLPHLSPRFDADVVDGIRQGLIEAWRARKGNDGEPPEDLTIPCNSGHWDDLMNYSALFAVTCNEFADGLYNEAKLSQAEEDLRGNV
jgi:hypothetical protein